MERIEALLNTPVRRICYLIIAITCAPVYATGMDQVFTKTPRATVGVLRYGEKQMLICIGPGAAELPLPQLDPLRRTAIILHAVPRATSILRDAAGMSNVTGIAAFGTPLTEEDFAVIDQSCPNLVLFSASSPTGTLWESELSDMSYQEISCMKNADLSKAKCRSLGQFNKLQILHTLDYRISEQALSELTNAEQVVQLFLDNANLSESCIELISRFQHLRKLSLNKSQITCGNLPALASCRELEEISLNVTRVSDNFAKPWAEYLHSKPLRLRTLWISDCPITEAGLEAIREAAPFVDVHDKVVDLNHIHLEVGEAQSIREQRGLKMVLKQFFNAVYTQRSLPNGESERYAVTFRSDSDPKTLQRGDSIAACLGFQKYLTTIELKNSGVTDAGLHHLRPLSLECLSLQGASLITDAVIDEISNHHSLKVLSLSGTGITDHGIVQLVQCCNQLEGLLIDNTKIGDEAARALSRLPSLRYLSAKNCLITDEGTKHLLAIKTLSGCDLTGNLLNDENVIHDLQKLNYGFDPKTLPVGITFEPQ